MTNENCIGKYVLSRQIQFVTLEQESPKHLETTQQSIKLYGDYLFAAIF